MSREYPCVYYDNEKCKKFEQPGYTSWCVLGPCSHETPSNADRIRSMTDEELANWLVMEMPSNICDWEDLMLDWLKQPHTESEDKDV